jgi:hypothetical protein
MKVIVNPNIFYSEKVERSWKERLFTLPWKPFKKFIEINKPGCYRYENTLFIHTEIWEELKKQMESEKWSFNFRMPFGIETLQDHNPFFGIGIFS